MKTRKGFVSNSSSSSFICDICGKTASGFDISPCDFDMALCENGHIFCYDHAVDIESPCKVHYKYSDEDVEYDNMFEAEAHEGEVPRQYCPICNFKELATGDCLKYLALTGRDRNAILKEIKERFKTYKEFEDFLKENDR